MSILVLHPCFSALQVGTVWSQLLVPIPLSPPLSTFTSAMLFSFGPSLDLGWASTSSHLGQGDEFIYFC